MSTTEQKIDVTGWKPVVIMVGRGAGRHGVMIGYAGKANRGSIPLALPDGTPMAYPAHRGRGMFLGLCAMAKIKEQARQATAEEIERRYRK